MLCCSFRRASWCCVTSSSCAGPPTVTCPTPRRPFSASWLRSTTGRGSAERDAPSSTACEYPLGQSCRNCLSLITLESDGNVLYGSSGGWMGSIAGCWSPVIFVRVLTREDIVCYSTCSMCKGIYLYLKVHMHAVLRVEYCTCTRKILVQSVYMFETCAKTGPVSADAGSKGAFSRNESRLKA